MQSAYPERLCSSVLFFPFPDLLKTLLLKTLLNHAKAIASFHIYLENKCRLSESLRGKAFVRLNFGSSPKLLFTKAFPLPQACFNSRRGRLVQQRPGNQAVQFDGASGWGVSPDDESRDNSLPSLGKPAVSTRCGKPPSRIRWATATIALCLPRRLTKRWYTALR